MIEPISGALTALGILTANEIGSFLFIDVLLPLVQDTSKDYLKDFFKGCISNIATTSNSTLLQKSAGKALKEFLSLFKEELEFLGIESKHIKKQYLGPIKKFVYADAVKPILGKAFESDCRAIDTSALQDAWNDLYLPALPEDFDWKQIGKQYLRKVKGIIRESEQLRVILDSENLEAIRMQAEESALIPVDFNLQQYRESIQEFYGYLKLDTLHTSGYEYRLQLWKMFVP
ncbi:MAG TPA: hypothetical protein V6D15_02730 [Oculatellaceae cyanobacterium]|jgi:hypothetical protein